MSAPAPPVVPPARARPSARSRSDADPRFASESGSGSVLALSIVLAAIVLGIALITAQAAHLARTRAAVAADAAALAAADTASGRIPGDACARAAMIAGEHGAELVHCAAHPLDSRVTTRVVLGPFHLEASARAGPPPGSNAGPR